MEICVVVKNPGQKATVMNIEDSLESLQHLVGGYIEMLSFKGIDFIVNEEGALTNLPFNTFINNTPILGTIIAVSHNDEGDTIGLTHEQVNTAINILK